MSSFGDLVALTQAQGTAFASLKRAYSRCKNLGIVFVNHHGTLMPYNSALVEDMIDPTSTWFDPERVMPVTGNGTSHRLHIPGEWADDEGMHYFLLTDQGLELLRNVGKEDPDERE